MVGYLFSFSYPSVMAAIGLQRGQPDRPTGHLTAQRGRLTGGCSYLSHGEREL